MKGMLEAQEITAYDPNRHKTDKTCAPRKDSEHQKWPQIFVVNLILGHYSSQTLKRPARSLIRLIQADLSPRWAHLTVCQFYVDADNNNIMSRVMRNPAVCIDADQLRGNREADQRLCFRYIDSTIPVFPKSEISSL